MSSLSDNLHDPPCRHIFNCQDHLTKFCHLKPCTTKGGDEVANHLYHIFCEFDAPIILHPDKDDVDLGAADAPNIVCAILEKNDSIFKLCHKGVVLKEWFPFNVLHKIDGIAMSFSRDEVPMKKEISVREAIKIVSISNCKGFKQFYCRTGKCGQGTKFNCYKDGVKSNSICHKGEINKNFTNKTDGTKK